MSSATAHSSATWALQDAKAKLSELVRAARAHGPQHITLHGKDAVVVISTDEYRRLTGELTGQALIDLMANSPLADVEMEHEPFTGPVRDIDL